MSKFITSHIKYCLLLTALSLYHTSFKGCPLSIVNKCVFTITTLFLILYSFVIFTSAFTFPGGRALTLSASAPTPPGQPCPLLPSRGAPLPHPYCEHFETSHTQNRIQAPILNLIQCCLDFVAPATYGECRILFLCSLLSPRPPGQLHPETHGHPRFNRPT